MKKSEILFGAEESERTGGLTFVDEILSCARRLRAEKNGLEVCDRMRRSVGYSHEKQKQTARFSTADLISIPRESTECVPRT
jgi:hypothetical protein